MIPIDGTRFTVLDCLISRVDTLSATQLLLDLIAKKQGGYVCFSNVHTVIMARQDLHLREITNNSILSMPDGKPLSLLAKWRGIADVDRVAGPDYMPYFIQTAKGIRHYFFGSTPEVLEELVISIRRQYPDAVIAGSYPPPFGNISVSEMEKILRIINQAKPDVIWVGLGAPKQEYWMAEHWRKLKPAILMGVGAAFDVHAGKIPRAPGWMRKMSIEWLYRLYQEPRRLWKRYLVTNTLFCYYLLLDTFRGKKRPQAKT